MSETDNHRELKTFFSEEYNILKAYVNSRITASADRDAEDIIQDVALKLFSRANNSLPINNVAGFVYNSIKNKIIDTMRTKKPQSNIQNESEVRLNELAELFYGKSDNSYSEKMKRELMNTIFNLKPHYREIIMAVDFEGYSYKRLSFETGIPPGTLMSRRHRALSILYKKLEKNKLKI